MESFHSALVLANLLYDLEMTPEDFEEIGLLAWNKIGNKQIKIQRYCGKINCNTLQLELPCEANIIEAVTLGFEDWNHTTNLHASGDYNSQFTETYIESRKAFNYPLYIEGKYVKFNKIDDRTLQFDKDYGTVNVLFKSIMLDDEGLPLINEKEKEAIATYCAYVKKYKEGLITNNSNIMQFAQLLEQKWLKLCDAARVPMNISQNELDAILDSKAKWNRKVYNKTYKPY